MDPAPVQRRKGARPPADAYLLRGFAFCTCGRAMYTRRQAVAGSMCSARREGRVTCNAAPIPAALAEQHVLAHLDCFVGDVADFLAQQVTELESEQEARLSALAVKRPELADLARKVAVAQTAYDEALGSDLASTALRQLGRLEAARDEQAKAIQEAEAVIGEWSGTPDLDAASTGTTAWSTWCAGRSRPRAA